MWGSKHMLPMQHLQPTSATSALGIDLDAFPRNSSLLPTFSFRRPPVLSRSPPA